MNVNKTPLVDFETINSGSTKFTDSSFPYNDALYWKDAGQKNGDMS